MYKKIVVSLLIFILLSSVITYANSAEVPSVVIIVDDAPYDLEITFITDDEEIKSDKSTKRSEMYFSLGMYDLKSNEIKSIRMTSSTDTFLLDFDGLTKYNSVFRLNYEDRTLKQGKGVLRSIKLILTRVFLTLIIEGCVFYLFGFRDDDSIMIFLVINLLTQGFLNLWINTLQPLDYYGVIMTLVIAEFIIVVLELIGFLKYIDEKGKFTISAYVITANLVSMILGMIIIPSLPI